MPPWFRSGSELWAISKWQENFRGAQRPPFLLIDCLIGDSICSDKENGACLPLPHLSWSVVVEVFDITVYVFFFNKMAAANCCHWRQLCAMADAQEVTSGPHLRLFGMQQYGVRSRHWNGPQWTAFEWRYGGEILHMELATYFGYGLWVWSPLVVICASAATTVWASCSNVSLGGQCDHLASYFPHYI